MAISKARLQQIDAEIKRRAANLLENRSFMDITFGGSMMRFEMALGTEDWLTPAEFNHPKVNALIERHFDELYDKHYDDSWYDA